MALTTNCGSFHGRRAAASVAMVACFLAWLEAGGMVFSDKEHPDKAPLQASTKDSVKAVQMLKAPLASFDAKDSPDVAMLKKVVQARLIERNRKLIQDAHRAASQPKKKSVEVTALDAGVNSRGAAKALSSSTTHDESLRPRMVRFERQGTKDLPHTTSLDQTRTVEELSPEHAGKPLGQARAVRVSKDSSPEHADKSLEQAHIVRVSKTATPETGGAAGGTAEEKLATDTKKVEENPIAKDAELEKIAAKAEELMVGEEEEKLKSLTTVFMEMGPAAKVTYQAMTKEEQELAAMVIMETPEMFAGFKDMDPEEQEIFLLSINGNAEDQKKGEDLIEAEDAQSQDQAAVSGGAGGAGGAGAGAGGAGAATETGPPAKPGATETGPPAKPGAETKPAA